MLALKIRSEAPLTGPFLMRPSRESEKDVFDAGMFIDPPEAHRYPSSGCDHNSLCHVSRPSAAHDGALPPGTGPSLLQLLFPCPPLQDFYEPSREPVRQLDDTVGCA